MGNKNLNLFGEEYSSDEANDWREEWKGMPEYSNDERKPYKSVVVHFRTEEDYEKFAQLVDQNLTPKTKGIWFPKLAFDRKSKLRYSDES